MKTATITTEQFNAELISILETMTAAQIIDIPGIYEVLSEEFNNEVLNNLSAEEDEETDDE